MAVLGACAALLGAAACAPEPEPPADPVVEVGGEFGTHPQISFTAPLDVTRTSTTELIHGDGTVLAEGAAVMLAFTAVDAATGEPVDDSYNSQPEPFLLTPDMAGPLYAELLGRTEGSRLLRIELGTAEKPDPLVLVYDILHTRAHGEAVTPSAGMPTVTLDPSGAPVVTVPDGVPPEGLVVEPLIRGSGAQVRAGVAVTMRYTSVAWSTGAVVETLWGAGVAPTTVPFTGLIQGWEDGLVDVRVGSQVMLIVPPDQAFGTDTLVYVIDVLAVSLLDGTDGGAG